MHSNVRYPFTANELIAQTTKGENVGKWEDLKGKGNPKYKTGEMEPIDLLKAGDMLRDFALGCIIKYAFRNRGPVLLHITDMQKIIHYAEMLITAEEEEG